MEPVRNHPEIEPAARRRILERLLRAALFEQVLNRKYVGVTRFSLGGGDGLIPMLDDLVNHAAENGRSGNHPGHGPPWAAERPDPHSGKILRGHFQRIRAFATIPRRSWEPATSSTTTVTWADLDHERRSSPAGISRQQPQPSGSGGPCRGGDCPCPAGPSGTCRRRTASHIPGC